MFPQSVSRVQALFRWPLARVLAVLSLGLSLAVAQVAVAQAQAQTPEPWPPGTVVFGWAIRGALVRAEASTAAAAVGSILYGESVTVVSGPQIDAGGLGWYEVRTGSGTTGWVYQALLGTASPNMEAGATQPRPAANAPSATRPAAPTVQAPSTMGPSAARCSTWRVSTPTSLRIERSQQGPVFVQISAQSIFTVLDTTPSSDLPGWIFGEVEGQRGWIRRDVLAFAVDVPYGCPRTEDEALTELTVLTTMVGASDWGLLASILILGTLGLIAVMRLTRVEHLPTKTVTFASTVFPVVIVASGLVGIFRPIPMPVGLPISPAAAWVGYMYVVNSLVALAVFKYDKWASQQKIYRVPENTLHLVEFLCGWPGALIAIFVFRHKNRKGSFLVVTGLIVLAHLAFWVWLSLR